MMPVDYTGTSESSNQSGHRKNGAGKGSGRNHSQTASNNFGASGNKSATTLMRQGTGRSSGKNATEITNASLQMDPGYLRLQQNRLDYQRTFQQAQLESMSRTSVSKINNLFGVGTTTGTKNKPEQSTVPLLPEKALKKVALGNSSSSQQKQQQSSLSQTHHSQFTTSQNKSEMRLKNSQSQFMNLADKLLGNAMKNSSQMMLLQQSNASGGVTGVAGVPNNGMDVKQAMIEANGYNLISSKSTKVLPLNQTTSSLTAAQTARLGAASKITNEGSNATGNSQIQQQTSHAAMKAQKLYRVGDSVQNILQREQLKDGKLANRLKLINNKQAARIREIETQEIEKQQEELHKIVAGDGNIETIERQFLQTTSNPVNAGATRSSLQVQSGLVTNQPMSAESATAQILKQTTAPISRTEKQSLAPVIQSTKPQESNESSTMMRTGMAQGGTRNQKFYSSNRQMTEQNMSKSQSTNMKKLTGFQLQQSQQLNGSRERDESSSAKRNPEDQYAKLITQQSQKDGIWNISRSQLPAVTQNNTSKSRPDVSFLQEKVTTQISQNAAKKIALDTNQGLLLSQSQLTSGNEGRDEYLQVALGLRQIGKSITDMPKNLDDLRMLSREYMKNLGVVDDMADEQVYLAYIEDHLKAQENQTAHEMSNISGTGNGTQRQFHHLSPIRVLADYYQRKLNKIQATNTTFTAESSSILGQSVIQHQNKSPNKTQRVTNNQTYVDIEKMTVLDLEKLEQSPPRINPRRKNLRVVNSKAMAEFGQEAFNIDLGGQQKNSDALKDKKMMSRLQKISALENQEVGGEEKKPQQENESQAFISASISPKQKKTQIKFLNSNKDTVNNSSIRKEERNVTSKKQLLQSLNDLGDQLIRPSIGNPNDEKDKPQWLQNNIREEAARLGLSQSNLGKPSSRQDAILLAQWFKGIIDMIEMEHQNSKTFFAKQGPKKTFQTQKVHENEISQTDSYLLIQIAHNIAIKEITRQVSVQCIERGILLKTVFDSYVRMVDLIFADSVAQRKLLAQKFANVCERQVFYQCEQIRVKDQIIERKEKEIQSLREELEMAEQRETSLKFTNKKLAAIAHRSQNRAIELERLNMTLERQMDYLNKSMEGLADQIDPERAQIMLKERKKTLRKIQTQADIDHIQIINSKRQQDGDTAEASELQIVAGEIIKTRELGTDMFDFKIYLEEINGGPLELDLQMQTSLHMEEVSNSEFDLYDVGAIKDQETMIDDDWRRQTRAKPLKRPASQSNKETKKLVVEDKRLLAMDDVSFETSSHNSLDYLLKEVEAKSFTFGFGRRYKHHIRMPRPQKRTLSAASFNWNLLVDRVDGRLEREAQEKAKLNSGTPMVKLTEILGHELLQRIKDEYPELYEQLMEHIANKQSVTYAFCRMLLHNYNINLDLVRKQQRLKYGEQFMDELNENGGVGADNQNFDGINLNDSMEKGDGDINYSDMIAGGTANKQRRTGRIQMNNSKRGTDREGFKFAQWNFQKRMANKKKERYRKDHPSFPIVTRLLERFKAGKEIKELMPVKGAIRVIHQVYIKKAEDLKLRSTSPENQNASQQDTQSITENTMSKKVSTMSPKPSKKRTSSDMKTPDGSQHGTVQGGDMSSPNLKPVGIGTVSAKRTSDQQAEKGDNVATSTNMCEFVYEYFQNKYGLKAAGEKKFSQFIGAMLKYREKYSRFNLFGRFLELYDELGEDDVKLYLDLNQVMYKTVLNFQILEHDEVILIPTARAIDYFRLTLAQRLTNNSMQSCLRVLRKKQIPVQKVHSEKHPHLKMITDAIPLDDFAEILIMTTNQLQAEKLQNIADIFAAVDLDGNGILGFNELRTLHRLLCNQTMFQNGQVGDTNQMIQECRILFNEYAQHYTDIRGAEGLKVRGISFDQFEKMCLEKDIYTIRQQNQFINLASKTFLNVTEAPSRFSSEFARVSANIDSIYERLTDAINDMMDTQVVSDSDKLRYQDMVEQMVKAVMKPVNKKVAFLTFKIVEETVKRVVLKAQTEKLMPFQPLTIKLVKTALLHTTEDSKSQQSVPTVQNRSISQHRNTSVSPKDRDQVRLVNLEDIVAADHTSKTAGNNNNAANLIAPFAKTGTVIANDFQSQASSRNNNQVTNKKRGIRMQTYQKTGSLRKSIEENAGATSSTQFEKLHTENGFVGGGASNESNSQQTIELLKGTTPQHNFNSRRRSGSRPTRTGQGSTNAAAGHEYQKQQSAGGNLFDGSKSIAAHSYTRTASQGFTPVNVSGPSQAQNAQAFPGRKMISTVISKGSAAASTSRKNQNSP